MTFWSSSRKGDGLRVWFNFLPKKWVYFGFTHFTLQKDFCNVCTKNAWKKAKIEIWFWKSDKLAKLYYFCRKSSFWHKKKMEKKKKKLHLTFRFHEKKSWARASSNSLCFTEKSAMCQKMPPQLAATSLRHSQQYSRLARAPLLDCSAAMPARLCFSMWQLINVMALL